jgi:hypothetical protein
VTVVIPEKAQSMPQGPLVENLRMVRDEDQLSMMILNRFLCRLEPRLYFPQLDKIVWLVDKYGIAFGYYEVKDHIQPYK